MAIWRICWRVLRNFPFSQFTYTNNNTNLNRYLNKLSEYILCTVNLTKVKHLWNYITVCTQSTTSSCLMYWRHTYNMLWVHSSLGHFNFWFSYCSFNIIHAGLIIKGNIYLNILRSCLISLFSPKIWVRMTRI